MLFLSVNRKETSHFKTTVWCQDFFAKFLNLNWKYWKLAYVLTELLKNLGLAPGTIPNTNNPIMKGTNFTPGAEPTPGQPIQYTEAQSRNLEKAFAIILQKLDYQTVLNLASKMHKGEAEMYIPLLRNFANQ